MHHVGKRLRHGGDDTADREYELFRCWVSEFQASPESDANTTTVAITSMTLEHEGWERRATAGSGGDSGGA